MLAFNDGVVDVGPGRQGLQQERPRSLRVRTLRLAECAHGLAVVEGGALCEARVKKCLSGGVGAGAREVRRPGNRFLQLHLIQSGRKATDVSRGVLEVEAGRGGHGSLVEGCVEEFT